MWKILMRTVFCFFLMFFLLSNNISYQSILYSEKTKSKTLALQSIFHDNENIEKVMNTEGVQTLIELYNKGKINDKAIDSLISYFESIVEIKGKQDVFGGMRAKLRSQIYGKDKFEKQFAISNSDAKSIISDFRKEMKRGINSKQGLPMLSAHVDKATGQEKGTYFAIDFGGSNLRVLKVDLKENGKIANTIAGKWTIPEKLKGGTAASLFDFIADCVKEFMQKHNMNMTKNYSLGFTFSFPVKQESMASGNLVAWNKGFDIPEVVGGDVVDFLAQAFIKADLANIEIVALCNDTVGALQTGAYKYADCRIACILGTGTNIAYVTKNGSIINIESGAFNGLYYTPYDQKADKYFGDNIIGKWKLLKMISGGYLGEIARTVIIDFIKKGSLFEGKGSKKLNETWAFTTENMSEIEKDSSEELEKVETILENTGINNSTIADRKLVKRICKVISTRSAQLAGIGLAAVIKELDIDLENESVTIAIDGSLYEKYHQYKERLRRTLEEIFGDSVGNIKLIIAKDGSGLGAAIIAATAAEKSKIAEFQKLCAEYKLRLEKQKGYLEQSLWQWSWLNVTLIAPVIKIGKKLYERMFSTKRWEQEYDNMAKSMNVRNIEPLFKSV